jgi:hypothetical protein
MPAGYRKTVHQRFIGIARTRMERGSDELGHEAIKSLIVQNSGLVYNG